MKSISLFLFLCEICGVCLSESFRQKLSSNIRPKLCSRQYTKYRLIRGGELHGWSDTESKECVDGDESTQSISEESEYETDEELEESWKSKRKSLDKERDANNLRIRKPSKNKFSPLRKAVPSKSLLLKAAKTLKVVSFVALSVVVALQILRKCNLQTFVSLVAFIVYAVNLYQKTGGSRNTLRGALFDLQLGDRGLGRRHFSFEPMNFEFSPDKEALKQMDKKINVAILGLNKTSISSVAGMQHLLHTVFEKPSTCNTQPQSTNAEEMHKKDSIIETDDDNTKGDDTIRKQAIEGEPKGTSWTDKLQKIFPFNLYTGTFDDTESDVPMKSNSDVLENNAGVCMNVTAEAYSALGTQNVTAQESREEMVDELKPQSKVYVLELTAQDVVLGMGSFVADAVSFLLETVRPNTDEVVILLTSPGGGVGEYGLAAAHLERLRSAGVQLTVCVDTVAASGGYMMAAVASHLVAAPFALVGSIGVMGATINIHKALKKLGVENYLLTAGKYKAPIGLTNEVTRETLEKYQLMINDVQAAFKAHIARHRPFLNIDLVGTGEVWLGLHAKSLGLVDEISTSTQYIGEKMKKNAQVIRMVKYTQPQLGIGVLRKALLGPFAKIAAVFQKLDNLLEVAEAAVKSSGIKSEGMSEGDNTSVKLDPLYEFLY